MPDSIIGRLRLLLATAFAASAIAAMAAAWAFSITAATEAYDRLLISAATQISDALSVEQERFSVLPPDSAFETLAQSKGDRFLYAVRTPDGTLLTGDAALRPLPMPPRDGGPRVGYVDSDGDRMRVVAVYRLIASPNARGWCSVVVAQSLDARHQLALKLMLRIGAIVLFGGVLGYLASLEAAKRVLRPFDRIGQALAERNAQDTGPLDVDSPRETRALVEAINAAFQRLDQRLNMLQSFAGIAAHQIRTPLSVLGAQTELLLGDETAHARHGRIAKIRTHVLKLSRLTNQLLGQAMVSYRTERIPHRRIEVVGLVRYALRDAIPESLDRDIAVEFEPAEAPVFIVGDAVMLREALVNLLNNAVTHGAASTMRVRIGTKEGRVVIAIADDGPGIPAALWDSARQPFRLSRTDSQGAGLGLSITAEVARAHGSELSFGWTEDGLFEIIMTLAMAVLPDNVA